MRAGGLPRSIVHSRSSIFAASPLAQFAPSCSPRVRHKTSNFPRFVPLVQLVPLAHEIPHSEFRTPNSLTCSPFGSAARGAGFPICSSAPGSKGSKSRSGRRAAVNEWLAESPPLHKGGQGGGLVAGSCPSSVKTDANPRLPQLTTDHCQLPNSISPRRAAIRQSQTAKSMRSAIGFQKIFSRFGFFFQISDHPVYVRLTA